MKKRYCDGCDKDLPVSKFKKGKTIQVDEYVGEMSFCNDCSKKIKEDEDESTI